MPHKCKRTGEVIVRVVYDGAPEAGKTTNVRMLSEQLALQRRGRMVSPAAESGRRTEFFDWLDFAGGYVDGHRLRCQLLSVPGQLELLSRRRHLLGSADAIIFVADSRAAYNETTSEALAKLLSILRQRARGGFEPGFVLQANKQDLPDALSPVALAEELDVPPSVACFGAVAEDGTGVTETFMAGIRLAVERVRSLLLSSGLGHASLEDVDPAALLQTLLRNEGSEAPTSPPPTTSPTVQLPKVTPLPPSESLPPPRASWVPSGCAWPPVRGRAILYAAADAKHDPPERVVPWAPTRAIQLRAARDWLLHTCPRWEFATLQEGSEALRNTVRQQLALGNRAPGERALVLAPSGAAFRLWMITLDTETLGQQLRKGLQTGDPATLREVLTQVARAVLECAGDSAEDASGVQRALDCVAFEQGNLRVLALPEPRTGPSGTDGLAHDALTLLQQAQQTETHETLKKVLTQLKHEVCSQAERDLLVQWESVLTGPDAPRASEG